MTPTVRLLFGPDEVVVTLPAGEAPWPSDQARRWLDDQFVANGCEPLRASGKVLTADKVLALADAIGVRGFERDEALRHDFARAVTAALAKSMVAVDVDAQTLSF